ncbi:MAG: EAL domain-containing protein [Rhodospirillaceae bacterium]|nr:EAL domain-containing protein [Rhodospirillaceae bacterium]MBT4671660.1 EAL domain-containing protein [Rhodospirillaceae bacterium]MBT6857201.1 EAL domain-containing protein [Rhodospirillaceae bacterium]
MAASKDTKSPMPSKNKSSDASFELAELFTNSASALALWGQDGRLMQFNDHFRELYQGRKFQVAAGSKLSEADAALKSRVISFPGKSQGNLLLPDRRKSGKPSIIDIQLDDGSWWIVTARGTSSGQVMNSIFNVTGIKQNELEAQRLAQRNAQMAVAISAMDSGVVITNPNMPDNPIVFVNPAFVPPPNISRDNLLGKPFQILFQNREDRSALKHLLKDVKRQKLARAVLPRFANGGSPTWHELRLNPVLGDNGRVNYYLGIQTDVTVSKQSELELQIRMSQQSAIAELGHRALAGADLEELFDDAVRMVAAAWNAKYVSIEELAGNGGRLRLIAGTGWNKSQLGKFETRISRTSILSRVLTSGNTETVRRSAAEAGRNKGLAGAKKLRQSVVAAISGREMPYGILAVHGGAELKHGPDDINFLESMAYVLGVAVERALSEEAIRESEYRFELAVKGSNDGIWDWDIKRDRTYISARWKTMIGFDEKSRFDNMEAWIDNIHSEDQELFRSALKSHLSGEAPYFICEHRMLHHDGTYRWMLARGLAVRDTAGKATRIAGSLSDINENKHTEHQLLKDALHDSLTGLPNRALFTDRVTQAISRTMRNSDFLFAVMFLDFDRFKMVNDSLGHSYGDQMLIEISYRLRDCVREIDTVARLGGDEFAILLEDIDAEDEAEEVARRINKLLGGPFRLADKDIVSNASIGIAFSSLGYSHPEEMIRDADIAMYQAKSQGRARHIVFDKGMHVLAVTQLEIETDLRQAIENDEFLLYYQPVMNAENEKISGFEALIRWQHPRRGFVPPGDFIAIAEETKLIIPIGRWVIREAAKQARIWQRAFPKQELNVSVNIAPQQFTDPNLIDDIRDALAETKLPGQRLKVEITESAIMENPHEVTQRLNQIREMGVQLHVDDFGTGYSSLSHLHRFPIDALKVDRSFVISMGESDENMEIVRTIIALAHNLKLKTVAEGVETRGALEQLKKLGCDFAQGYFFSRPLEVSDATKFISKNT